MVRKNTKKGLIFVLPRYLFWPILRGVWGKVWVLFLYGAGFAAFFQKTPETSWVTRQKRRVPQTYKITRLTACFAENRRRGSTDDEQDGRRRPSPGGPGIDPRSLKCYTSPTWCGGTSPRTASPWNPLEVGEARGRSPLFEMLYVPHVA